MTPTAPTPPAPVLTTVTVTLSATTIQVGRTATANVSGVDQHGASMGVGAVTWSSGSTAVATVSTGGVVTAVAPGQTSIIVSAGGRTGQQSVAVIPVPSPVARIVISPVIVTLFVGATQQLTATTFDAAGTVLRERVVTWVSHDPAKATVSDAGLLTATAVGSPAITATCEGLTAIVVVSVRPVPVPVASVSISPDAVTLFPGAAQQLTASPLDASGGVLTGRVVSWATSDSTTASVSTEGAVTAVAIGNAIVTATSEGKSGTASVTVRTVPVASLRVSPQSTTVVVGGTQQFTATPFDANGRVLEGRTISWLSSSPGVAIVSESGLATAVATGTTSLAATSEGRTGTATLSVTTAPIPVTRLTANAGDNQTAIVGSAVATHPSVMVRDAGNNAVPGVSVTFAVASGGGAITGPTQVTNASGIATVGSWTLGPTVGTNRLSATSTGLSGSPVSFSATGTAGAATQITVNAGNNQTASVSSGVNIRPSVLVRDANNNAVSGVTVTFAVASGGGAISGAAQGTDANGIATVGSWTLGPAAGTNTLTAASTGLSGSPVIFTATGAVTGAATKLVLTTTASGAASGLAFTTQPVVAIRDAAGITVTSDNSTVVRITVSAGGTIVGWATKTAVNGIAYFAGAGLSGTAGVSYTLTYAATGLSSTTQSITPTAGTGSQIIGNTGNNQAATVGSSVGIRPSVIVRDASNNAVSGVSVTFAVTAGGGAISGPTQLTNASGIAAVGSWTLGMTAGVNTIRATPTGLASPSVTLSATGLAGPATQISRNAGHGQSATAGSTVGIRPSVIVRDANNNAVSGVNVTFAVTSGGGSISGSTQVTNASGIATVGNWTLGNTAGTNSLAATASGSGISGTAVPFVATGAAPGGGGSNLRIELRFLDAASAAQYAAFTAATARWQSLVTAKLTDIPVNLAVGGCDNDMPAVNETIDDIVIFVTLDSIDGPGKILGMAGPCIVRSPSHLPVLGTLHLDKSDLTGMESNGSLSSVILHEMGHVLGIGTTWHLFPGLLVNPSLPSSPGADTRFTGANAIAGFDAIGGLTYTGGGKVPVENSQGDAGTRDAHWRESVLATELMTGFIGTGSNPLSLVTVRSLQDIGYSVNPSLADPFALTLTRAGLREPGVTGVQLSDDVRQGDIMVVDDRGRVLRVESRRRRP